MPSQSQQSTGMTARAFPFHCPVYPVPLQYRHGTDTCRMSPHGVMSSASPIPSPSQTTQDCRTRRGTSTEGAALLSSFVSIFFSLECYRGRAPAPSVCALGRSIYVYPTALLQLGSVSRSVQPLRRLSSELSRRFAACRRILGRGRSWSRWFSSAGNEVSGQNSRVDNDKRD